MEGEEGAGRANLSEQSEEAQAPICTSGEKVAQTSKGVTSQAGGVGSRKGQEDEDGAWE